MSVPPAPSRSAVAPSVRLDEASIQVESPASPLGELILSYNQGPFAELDVELVLNGDTFDLLKVDHLETYPHHITCGWGLGGDRRHGVGLSCTLEIGCIQPIRLTDRFFYEKHNGKVNYY